jgi:hypothetical protein
VLYPADLSDCLFCSIQPDQAVRELRAVSFSVSVALKRMKRILLWMLVALSLVAVLKAYQAYAPKRRFNVPQDVERQIEKAMRR